jgi:hypothetical protein
MRHSAQREEGITMTSRVNTPLKLSADGMTVQVVGPITEWESDERSAVFSVEITPQSGAAVSARGRSTRTYHPQDTHWQAAAHVTGPTPLYPGKAVARATAMVTHANGTTGPYHWTVDVVLDHQLAPAADAAQPIGTTP